MNFIYFICIWAINLKLLLKIINKIIANCLDKENVFFYIKSI